MEEYSQLIHNHDAEVYAPTASCIYIFELHCKYFTSPFGLLLALACYIFKKNRMTKKSNLFCWFWSLLA